MARCYDNGDVKDSLVEGIHFIYSSVNKLQRRLTKMFFKRMCNVLWPLFMLTAGDWIKEKHGSFLLVHIVITWALITYRCYRRYTKPCTSSGDDNISSSCDTSTFTGECISSRSDLTVIAGRQDDKSNEWWEAEITPASGYSDVASVRSRSSQRKQSSKRDGSQRRSDRQSKRENGSSRLSSKQSREEGSLKTSDRKSREEGSLRPSDRQSRGSGSLTKLKLSDKKSREDGSLRPSDRQTRESGSLKSSDREPREDGSVRPSDRQSREDGSVRPNDRKSRESGSKRDSSVNIFAQLKSQNGAIKIEDAIELERMERNEEEDEEITDDMPYLPPRSTRRETIYAETLNPTEVSNWKPKKYPKNDAQRTKIALSLNDIFLFRKLDANQLGLVIDAMKLLKVTEGEYLIKQGDEGDYFYVVNSGRYEAIIVDHSGVATQVKTYEDSGSFGELALLYNLPRAASIRALTDGSVWALDRVTFKKIVVSMVHNQRKTYTDIISKVSIFNALTEIEKDNLADNLERKIYADGTRIVAQGEEANGMYFIMEGTVRVVVTTPTGQEVEIKKLGSGHYFGELALLKDRPRAASVYAVGLVKLAFLDKDGFERLLGPCKHIMERNFDLYDTERSSALEV